MATPRDQAIQLTSLVQSSTSHLLAYAIPLLLLSLLLTFAGTFLTLDRTRSFAPRSDVLPPIPGSFESSKSTVARVESKLAYMKFRLDGGIGGLAIGYVFGLHASTFLALLILNESNSSPLSSTTFLVIWVLSVGLTTVLGGRWKPVALLFGGMMGGITISLALSVITHPSLFSRVALASVAVPLVTLSVLITCLVPSLALSNVAHATSRMVITCAGAFSTTMAVALLTRSEDFQPWANVWDRLWVADGSGWGTSKERGFDALFCLLWVTGATCDWALRRWIGEDPDERWDSYLAEYASALPNANDRVGNFRPLPSWWNKLLEKLHLSSNPPDGPMAAKPFDMLFPSDAELALKPSYLPVPGGDRDDKMTSLSGYDEAALTITPFTSDWDPLKSVPGRLIKKKSRARFGVVPEDIDSPVYDFARRPTFLQKAKAARVQHRARKVDLENGGRRAPVKFRPKDGFSSSDESSGEDEELKTPGETPTKTVRLQNSPMLRSNSDATSLTGTTVHPSGSEGASAEFSTVPEDLDIERERAHLAGLKSTFGAAPAQRKTASRGGSFDIPGAPEYSDVEEDVTNAYAYIRPQIAREEPGWTPEFLKRAASGTSVSSFPSKHGEQAEKSAVPPGAVPMTPSLVNALGRIAQAQAQAYGIGSDSGSATRVRYNGLPAEGHQHPLKPASSVGHTAISIEDPPKIPGLPFAHNYLPNASSSKDDKDGDQWDNFWKDVQAKAVEVEAR